MHNKSENRFFLVCLFVAVVQGSKIASGCRASENFDISRHGKLNFPHVCQFFCNAEQLSILRYLVACVVVVVVVVVVFLFCYYYFVTLTLCVRLSK